MQPAVAALRPGNQAQLDHDDPGIAALAEPGARDKVEWVYAGAAIVDGVAHGAAISVGTNPTFAGTATTVEAFLRDFSGDLSIPSRAAEG